MTAMVLTDRISQSSQKSRMYRTLRTQYGDGYEQRAVDGINDAIDTWVLNFDNLTETDRDTLWSFLDTVKMSGVIEWTAPGDSVEKKWVVVREPQEQAKAGNIYSVSFAVKQVFDL